MEQFNAAEWCDKVLTEYEALQAELIEIQFSGQESSSLLHKARTKRAQEKLKQGEVKAAAAALAKQLVHDAPSGSITFEIPNHLEVKLNW